MKKYLSVIAVLCTLVFTTGVVIAKVGIKSATSECDCCKDCKSDKCKDLCKEWNSMTAEAKKGDAGKKVKEDCAKICKEEKCCTSSCQSSCQSFCSGMDKKGCCKK